MDQTTKPVKEKTDRRTYMREYMKKRYQENPEKECAYRKTTTCIRVNHLPKEDVTKYGHYLSDVQKIRDLKKKIPEEFFKLLMAEFYNTALSTDSLSVSSPSPDSSSLGSKCVPCSSSKED